ETELCHRFIDPFLSALFDEPDNGVLFRCTTNQEAKETPSKASISNQRPDSCVTEMNGLHFGHSLGYVEVKPASEAGNQYGISKDLIRLCLLTKNSLDASGLKASLSIQLVNHKANILLNKLEADGFYVCTEIAAITIPNSIEHLGAFPSYFDDLIAILHCFRKWCVPMKPNENTMMYTKRRPSLPDEQFNMISPSRSNKRRAVTMP
ncbi:hypothetical protein BDB00DRAFT_777192, partial [Zychaea mexicana]|uniref:uncharacterized protein n=1 Tax=Zychaea mexicana TaxID=64656 RepID=UPI0022FDB905